MDTGINIKKCNKCCIIKQLDEFYIQERGLFGRQSICIECEKKRGKIRRESKNPPKEPLAPNMKRCTKCKNILFLKAFIPIIEHKMD